MVLIILLHANLNLYRNNSYTMHVEQVSRALYCKNRDQGYKSTFFLHDHLKKKSHLHDIIYKFVNKFPIKMAF